MPAIADTAYPRLPADPGSADLEAFTPEAADLAFARQWTRRPAPRLAFNLPPHGPNHHAHDQQGLYEVSERIVAKVYVVREYRLLDRDRQGQ